MPFGSEGREEGIGLALSGGGFRATLFHCGSLWRLNELGFLPRLTRISSVSGGSITSGWLGLQWPKLQFSQGIASNFAPLIVEPLRHFCSKTIDVPSILSGLLPWRKANEGVEAQYRKHLYGDATLQDLPDTPRFVFNATNLATGVSFRFSKPYAGDYRIGLIPNPSFKIARAVLASSAFPPVLSPVILDTDPASFTKSAGADLYDQPAYRTELTLSDGGVYDNMGLETVWGRYATVLVSDAGAPFDLDDDVDTDWARQTLRVLNIAVNQSRALRKRMLIEALEKADCDGTYWGIGTDIARYNAAGAFTVSNATIHRLATIRTRLNSFSETEQCELINWGYAVCDAAIRRYVATQGTPAPRWPYPQYALA